MTSTPDEKTCSKTGLRLRAANGQGAFRVAKDGRGGVSGYKNTSVGPLASAVPERRGRFDTLGTTVYLADSPRCAYAEVLTGFRKSRPSIERAAKSIGITTEEYVAQVLMEADRNGITVPWAIPADWQMGRSIFEVRLPTRGWWAVADHSDTLEALANLGSPLAFLVSGDIEGDDRSITTQLAQMIREVTLDDGSDPLGIEYRSKTLMGRCWAYWDRRADLGLPPGEGDLVPLASSNVGPDPDFHWVAGYYRLPAR